MHTPRGPLVVHANTLAERVSVPSLRGGADDIDKQGVGPIAHALAFRCERLRGRPSST